MAQEEQEAPGTPARSGSVRQRVEDASLATKIRIALAEEQGLGRYAFDPEVQEGRVTLQGDVETNAQREQAAEIAAEVEGVEAINNQVTIGGQPVVAEQEMPELDQEEAPATDDEPVVAEGPDETSEQQEPDTDEGPAEPESPEEEPAEEESSEEYYVVQSGDNLWTIARRHGTSVSQLRQLNNLSSNNLHPGDRLRVK